MTEMVTLRVNGREHPCRAGIATTLLTVLRDQCELPGTKRGCNQGVCGACSVLVDGKPVRACLTLATDCEDREVTTIEGVGTSAQPNAVQQALIDTGAVQCGFCTPGMLTTLIEFLGDNPDPTEQEVREAISGNLCRCTGYQGIVAAALDAAKRLQGQKVI